MMSRSREMEAKRKPAAVIEVQASFGMGEGDCQSIAQSVMEGRGYKGAEKSHPDKHDTSESFRIVNRGNFMPSWSYEFVSLENLESEQESN